MVVRVDKAKVAMGLGPSVTAYACRSAVAFPTPLPVPHIVVHAPKVLLEGRVTRSIKQSNRIAVVRAPARVHPNQVSVPCRKLSFAERTLSPSCGLITTRALTKSVG
jgi:hypothetical protein